MTLIRVLIYVIIVELNACIFGDVARLVEVIITLKEKFTPAAHCGSIDDG